MDEQSSFKNFPKNLISSREAAGAYGVTHDYIARLARQGKLKGQLQGRIWMVDRDSLVTFFAASGKKPIGGLEKLFPQKIAEAPAPALRQVAPAPAPVPPAAAASLLSHKKILAASILGALVLGAVFASAAPGIVSRVGARESLAAAAARVDSPFFLNPISSILSGIISFFAPHAPVAVQDQNLAPQSIATTSVTNIVNNYNTTNNTTNNNSYHTSNTYTTSQSGITQSELDAKLNGLRGEIFSSINSVPGPYSSGGPTNNIALTQIIDRLDGVTISNATVHSLAGLTDDDIPDTITVSQYLPLTGGTVTGDLTVLGTCTGCGGGGGSDSNWKYVNNSGIALATTTNQVLIGAAATSTLAKLEVVGGAVIDQATTTSFFSSVSSSTNSYSIFSTSATADIGLATTTQFFGSNLSVCEGGNVLTWNNGLFGCAEDQTSTGAANAFDYAANYGFVTAATTSPLWAQQGIFASSTSHLDRLDFNNATSTGLSYLLGGVIGSASSTIGNGSQQGGLTISGGATTTGNAYFAGNVGIGTANPLQKLEIANGSLSFSRINTFSWNFVTGDTFGINMSSSVTRYVSIAGTGAGQAGLLVQGNVGLGTTSPFAKLSVVGDIFANNATLTNITATGTVQFTNLGSGFVGSNNGTLYTFASTSLTTASSTLLSDSNTFSGENSFTGATTTFSSGATVGGNVGIGVTTPVSKLQVNGTNTALPTTNGYQQLELTSSANRLSLGVLSSAVGNAAAGTGVIQALVNSSAFTNLALNPRGGNVGVGTTSPFAKLSIQGNGYLSGDLSVAGLTATGTVQFTNLTGGAVAATANGTLYTFSTSTWSFASSTLLSDSNTFSGANMFLASTTIGNGVAGLTVSGNSTTTGNAYFGGSVGVGTTSATQNLTVNGNIQFATQGFLTGGSAGADAGFGNNLYYSGGWKYYTANKGALFWSGNLGELGFWTAPTGTAGGAATLTERMRLSNTGGLSLGNSYVSTDAGAGNAIIQGKVGIGTTSPFAKLSVVGDVFANNATLTNLIATGTISFTNLGSGFVGSNNGTLYTFASTSITAASSTLLSDSNTFSGGNMFLASSTIGNGTQTGGLTISGGATTTGNAYFAGNVGIGTSSPTSALEVSGQITVQKPYYGSGLYVYHDYTTSGGRPGVSIVQSSGSGGFASAFISRGRADSGAVVGYGTTGVSLSANTPEWYTGIFSKIGVGDGYDYGIYEATSGTSLQSSGNGLSGALRFVVNPGGNVGIGTTSPFAKLSIVGDTFLGGDLTATGTVQFTNLTGGAVAATTNGTLYTFSTSTWSFASSTLLGDSNTFSGATKFTGATTTFSNGATFAISGGNVGIGTTSPTQKLEIAGGSIQLDNNQSIKSRLTTGASVQLLTYTTGNLTRVGANTEIELGGYIALRPNGVEALRITPNGFGVGTTSPTARLTITATSSNSLFPLFDIQSPTTQGVATTSVFKVDAAGSTTLFQLPSSILKTDSNGTIIAAVAGTDYLTSANVAAYPFGGAGNSTSTLTQFNGGLTAYASSTIGNGAQAGGLTINGGATTTGNQHIGGDLSVIGNINFGNFHVDATPTCANDYHTFIGPVGTVGGDECAALNVTQQDVNNNVIYRFGEVNGAWAGEFFANALGVNLNTKTDVPLGFLINGDEKARIEPDGSFTLDYLGDGLIKSVGGTLSVATPDTDYATPSLVSSSVASAYPFGLTGNATSTLTQFNGGLTAYASSTIGNGIAGLTVSGNSTTTGTVKLTNYTNGALATDATGQLYTFSTSTWRFASSTLLSDSNIFSGLNLFLASTTIGNGTQGLTISGNSTTTGNAYFAGNLGLGTTSPYAKLSVVGEAVAANFTATSTIATSTFAGGLNVGNGALQYDYSSGLTSIQNLALGAMSFDTDAGQVSWVDLPISSNAATGTVNSYTAQIGGTPLLTIYSEAAGYTGGPIATSTRVGIGTTTPAYTFAVEGNSTLGNAAIAGYFTATTSTASTFPYASTTALTVSGTASTTNLISLNSLVAFATTTSATTTNLAISSIASGNLLKTTTGGAIVAAVAGTDYLTSANVAAYPFVPSAFGATAASATTTALQLQGGLFASSTVRFGNAGAAQFLFDSATGNLGLGTTTPAFTLDVNGVARGQIYDQGGAVYNVKSFGAKGDGATDDTAAFAAAFAALGSGKGTVYVPQGDYSIDNASGPFTINNFYGSFYFAGGARLIFTTNSQRALKIVNGSGARVENMSMTYQTPGTTIGGEAFIISSTTDITVSNFHLENAPSSGLIFLQNIRPKAVNITILHTLGDGLDFFNDQDGQVTNLTTFDTRDDGLAFVNFASGYNNYSGGNATNVTIASTTGRGIAIMGQSNVTVSNFSVSTTSDPGVLIAQDTVFGTRIPGNVTVSNGIIRGVGALAQRDNDGSNQYGMEYGTTYGAISFSNITILGGVSRGFSGFTTDGTLHASDIHVDGNQDGAGISLGAPLVDASNLTAENSPSYGIYIAGAANVSAKNLTAVNAAQSDALHRAVWFESNTNVNADGITVIDDQTTPTGYIVGGSSNTLGVINGIKATIPNATLLVQNLSSPGVHMGLVQQNSSTIGSGGQTTGLTVSGGATTTGNQYIAGSLGVGTPKNLFTFDIGGLVQGVGPFSGSNIPVASISTSTNTISGVQFSNTSSGGSADFRFVIASNDNIDSLSNFVPSSGNTGTLFGQTRSNILGLFSNASSGNGRILTLGTVNNNDVLLGTNNVERLRLTNTGNIGLGSSSPTARLTIAATSSNSLLPLFDIQSPTTGGFATSSLFKVNAVGSTTLYQIPSSILKTDSNGTIVAAVAGTDYLTSANVAAYPFGGAGNSTSTLTQFNGGLTAYASSTIGNGTLGLTVSGNSTTTGNAYFAGKVGIGTTSPSEKLYVDSNTDGNVAVFEAHNAGFGEIQLLDSAGLSNMVRLRNTQGLFSVFTNNSIQALNVTTSGYVGIGTTSPSQKLVVSGGRESIYGANASSNATYESLLILGASDGATGAIYHANNGTNPYLGFESYNVGNSVKTPLVFQQYGGNVGIGTTTPAAKLDVSGDAILERGTGISTTRTLTVGGAQQSDGIDYARLDFQNWDNNDATPVDYVGARISSQNQSGAESGNLIFSTYQNGLGGLVERARITASGNVGLGTSSPQTALHLSNNTATFRIQDANSSYPTAIANIEFYDNGTQNLMGSLGYNSDGNLTINQSNPSHYIVLTGSNVGIGTTSPFAKLSVAGNGYFDGSLTSGNLTATGTIQFTNLTGGAVAASANGTLYTFSTSTWSFASSTLLSDSNTFSGSNMFLASTTIGNGTQGLTVSGNATTTGISQLVGKVSVNSAIAPNASYGLSVTGGILVGTGNLSIAAGGITSANHGNFAYNDTTGTLNYTSSGSGSQNNVTFNQGGNFGIGTTTPGSLLSLGTINGINFSTATSTFSSTGGINLAAGCFAIAGNCIATSSSSGSSVGFTSIMKQTFTSSGTYTPSAGMLYAIIECVGGGGSGGGSFNNGAWIMIGGGGGSGGWSQTTASAASIGASQTVTIGAGGSPPAAGDNNGNAGGTTSVGTLCVANGGSGGIKASGSATAPASGGAVGTGTITFPGTPGGGAAQYYNTSAIGTTGNGGGTPYGGGGVSRTGYGASFAGGDAPANTGGGGGGASDQGTTAQAGGAGANGIVIITEYIGGAVINGSVASSSAGQVAYFSDYSSTVVGTSSLYIATSGNVGIGTTSSFAKLSVSANDGDINTTLFAIGSSTQTLTSTLFSVSNTGSTTLFQLPSSLLKTDANGTIVAAVAGVDYATPGGGGGSFPFTPTAFGNATSTLLQLNAGLIAQASTTIGDGTATGGLTISGNSTTTGNAYFAVNLGIGSTTPGSLLSLGDTGGINFSLATSSFNSTGGINLAAGCFAVRGVCLGGGASLTGTAGQVAYFSGANSAIGTSSLFIAPNGNLGVGTSSPFANLSVQYNNSSSNTTLFALASSTSSDGSTANTIFSVDVTGNTTIGSSAGAGDAVFQYGNDSNAWSSGYFSADKSFRIASSTNLASNVALTVAKGGNVGIGTTSPWAQFSITNIGSNPGLVVANSTNTQTQFILTNSGQVGIGTSTPATGFEFAVHGDTILGAGAGSVLTLNVGQVNRIAATTTIPNKPNAFSISTSTATGNGPIISISGNGSTSTISFFGATTTLLAGGATQVGAPSTVSNYIIVGNGKTPASIGVVRGSICVDWDGWCTASTTLGKNGGSIAVRNTVNVGNTDLAEMYTSTTSLLAGDIVATDGQFAIKAAEGDTKHQIIGVVSSDPGFVLGLGTDEDFGGIFKKYPVGLSGRVPTKVSLENGPIAIGDRITLSSMPGVGMKAGPLDPSVGIALEPYTQSATSTTIIVFLNLQKEIDTQSMGSALLGLSPAAGSSTAPAATSTTASYIFATSFLKNLAGILTGWLASAGNGIVDLFASHIHADVVYAKSVHTDELCVGQVCVTESQFLRLVGGAGQAPAPAAPSFPESGSAPAATSTPPTDAPPASGEDIASSTPPQDETMSGDAATPTPAGDENASASPVDGDPTAPPSAADTIDPSAQAAGTDTGTSTPAP